MPELSRSFHSVWLKTVLSGAVCGSLLAGLKSGTARRIGVPLLMISLTQSWAGERDASRIKIKRKSKNFLAANLREFTRIEELPELKVKTLVLLCVLCG